MRRGFTLVEALISAVVACSVIGMAVALFTATRRMSNAGDLSSALAEATVAMELLHRDLIQAVQKPDPTITDMLFISPTSKKFWFLRGEPDSSGNLTAELVVYQRVQTPGGHFRLQRQAGGGALSLLPGTYSAMGIETQDGTGGTFARITLHVVARDAAAGAPTGSDETVVTELMRMAPPEMLRSGMLRFRFMDQLKSIDVPKDM